MSLWQTVPINQASHITCLAALSCDDLRRFDYSGVTRKLIPNKGMWPNGFFSPRSIVCARSAPDPIRQRHARAANRPISPRPGTRPGGRHRQHVANLRSRGREEPRRDQSLAFRADLAGDRSILLGYGSAENPNPPMLCVRGYNGSVPPDARPSIHAIGARASETRGGNGIGPKG